MRNPPVTLRQLRAFVAVARTGSFTLAAESLFITQSALSGLIKELEQSLGLRLFDRSTRRLQLSEVGRELQPHINKILQDLDAVMDEAGHLRALRRGVVRVAVPQLLACTLLPDLVRQFNTAQPNIRIHLQDSAVDTVMHRVFTGEADFGLGPERDPNSDIQANPVFAMPFMAVLPDGHRLLAQQHVQWQQLATESLITLHGSFTDRLLQDVTAASEGAMGMPAAPLATTATSHAPEALDAHHPIALRTALSSSTQVVFMTTALAMVSAGQGISVCLPYAESLVHRYGLHLRPLRQPEVTRSFFIFTRKGRTLTPAAQAFHDFLRDELHSISCAHGGAAPEG